MMSTTGSTRARKRNMKYAWNSRPLSLTFSPCVHMFALCSRYLSGAFGESRALVFLPKLARLVPDEGRRKALLSAPKKAHSAFKAAAEPDDQAAAAAGAAPRFPAGAAAAAAAIVGDDFDAPPPSGGGGGGGTPLPPAPGEAVDPSSLSPDAKQVHEMFPSLPIPCILHALQEAPVGVVIEKALAGRIDPNATPKPADPQKLQVRRRRRRRRRRKRRRRRRRRKQGGGGGFVHRTKTCKPALVS
jgi:hypothetical protein